MSQSERAQIKFFDEEKGWGFVKRAGGADDAFLHSSVLRKCRVSGAELCEDREVEVVVGPGKAGKGPQVENIVLV